MEQNNKTLLVLGATSGVAQAYLRLAAEAERYGKYFLLARDASKLERVKNDIEARSNKQVEAIEVDLADPTQIASALEYVRTNTEVVTECLLAYGVLGDQSHLQENPASLQNMLETNFVSATLWMEAIAGLFDAQGKGHLVVIGSVAGDRGRQSNYLYGATKAGLERVAEGMAHRFADNRDISITLVKPGFIDTPMTAHIDKSGPLWAKAEDVAKSVMTAVDKKRVRIYTPWFWRWILLIVRYLPIFVFHKTKL